MKWVKMFENYNDMTITLYHGTCEANAIELVRNGWKPREKQGYSANMGQSRYLYLTSGSENAEWFANEHGCNTVVKVSNVPINYLIPDPEDEAGYTITELLNSLEKDPDFPRNFALLASLPAEYFSIL